MRASRSPNFSRIKADKSRLLGRLVRRAHPSNQSLERRVEFFIKTESRLASIRRKFARARPRRMTHGFFWKSHSSAAAVEGRKYFLNLRDTSTSLPTHRRALYKRGSDTGRPFVTRPRGSPRATPAPAIGMRLRCTARVNFEFSRVRSGTVIVVARLIPNGRRELVARRIRLHTFKLTPHCRPNSRGLSTKKLRGCLCPFAAN